MPRKGYGGFSITGPINRLTGKVAYGITPTGSWSLGAVCGNANQGGPVLVYQVQATAASIAVTASQPYAWNDGIHIAAFAP